MFCPQCQRDIPPHLTVCPHCEFWLGFPNVREASSPVECQELGKRYQSARDDARRRNCEPVLDQFENAVRQSQAAICRRWGAVVDIVERNNGLFQTFYQQLSAGTRLPQDNDFDRMRLEVDAKLFPYFGQLVHFSVLSLENQAPTSYGECILFLRETSIAHRTTVFEENTLVFCRKHAIRTGDRPPPGYRAVWTDRHRLAVAKLHGKIDINTTPAAFAGILMQSKGATDTDEFIEAHIYGKLDLTAVERLRTPKPNLKDDQVLARRLRRKIEEKGAIVEII